MSLLLVFGGVSKEYLHLFTGHTDTVCEHDEDGLHFEPEHHHCDFLSFTLPPFAQDAVVYEFPLLKVYSFTDYTETVAQVAARNVPVSHLRGPPASLE